VPGFEVKPTLTGERVVLRPFLPTDLTAMAACLSDPDVIRLTGSAHSSAEVAEIVRASVDGLDARTTTWYLTRNDQIDRLDLAIVERATDVCVGEVVLNDVDTGNRSCGFRTLIGPAGRDRGLGSESTRLIVDYAIEQLGMHRVELEVYAFNPRAQRVYEKAGFVVEGRRRHALRFDDEWIDAITMAVVAGDSARART
jgi:RimJ/RimL family protein N-acetyltransferase